MTRGHRLLRLGPIQIRFSSIAARRACLLVGLTVLAVAIGSEIGTYPVGALDIGAALSGQLDRIDALILLDFRLPRLVAALVSGAAFGAAGAIFQALLRNPLATPDIIGLAAGASAGAVMTIAFAGGAAWLPGEALLGGAFLGCLAAAVITFLLSLRDGLSIHRLVLVGIGVSFTLAALTDFLLTRMDILRAGDAAKWLAGSIDARSWPELALPIAGIGALLMAALWLQYHLNRMQMGDDLATSLGIPVNRTRIALSLVGVALTALAVTLAGPLPFVALIAGPIAKRIIGTNSAAIFSASLVGALITLCADIAARNALGSVQLPTGVFTALIGAPYFLALLFFQIKRGHL
ncbi:FecCD family ABC transporter permease [Roseibium sp.]|uniref:FecCD family ABC transporter permease n=1 Tax=Roseibium sp. TaxID=1936156 RepID=UPI003A984F09